MKCRDIMKMNVECVTPADNCYLAAQRMRDQNLGFLPVCDEYMEPLGTITDRDLCIRICAENKMPSQTRVSDIMTHHVVSCSPNDDLVVAEDLMAKHKKSRIMVVENGKLIGIISLSDIAKRESGEATGNTLRGIVSREVRP